jgi:hypothetical protein
MVNGDVASVQIAPRNRQIVNGAVRRLGFAPIPGRRSNSIPGVCVSMAGVSHVAIGDARKNIGGAK